MVASCVEEYVYDCAGMRLSLISLVAWVPQKATHKAARDIIRYIRDTAPNPKWTSQHSTNQTSLDVVDLDLDESKDKRQASAKRKLSAGQHTDLKRVREDSTVSNSYARNGVSTTKRHKKHNAGQSWKENPNTIADSGPGGLFPSGPFSSASIDEPTHSHATRSSTKDALFKHIARPPSANFVVREPRKKGPNLSVSFQDSSGEVRGTFTYEECDTAQKLFDVACVAQIAQIEPPATRLLKIKFSGGGEGRLRPDNEQDFQIVFEAELKKLVTGALGGSEFHVTISPYL